MSVSKRAETLFETHFGHAPEGVWSAPGRLNLIGEHTDYNDGWAMPFAIPQRTSVAAAARTDGVVEVVSGQRGAVRFPATALGPGLVAGWAGYPLGVLWALREEVAEDVLSGGLSLSIESDVPTGAGLSSSAALEGATALAINDLAGLGLSRARLAWAGHRAENEVVGAPTGLLDQTAAMLAVNDAALLLDCRTLEASTVALGFESARIRVLVFDSLVSHELADGGYAKRRAECTAAARALGVASLGDLASADVVAREPDVDPVLWRRALHVSQESERVLAAAALLRAGRPEQLGPLVTASHASLRDLFEVSVPELDAMVDAAVGAGALGARMVGGGFGGSMLALVPVERVDSVTAAMRGTYARRGLAPAEPLDVAPSEAARRDA